MGINNEHHETEWLRTNSKKDFFKNKQNGQKIGPVQEGEKEKKAIQNFRDLKIWQLGKEIVIETYKLTRSLPSEELYGLTSQMRRAAISVPCNICEGHSRRATRDYQRFLKMAAGSCAELETQVEVAVELNYLKAAACSELAEKIAYETRMLRKLISKLSENSFRHPSSVIQNKERVTGPMKY